MSDFLVFWPPNTKSGIHRSERQEHWAGGNLKFVHVGDTLWIVKVESNGCLTLLFPLVVGWHCYHEDPRHATKEAAQKFGNDDIWFSKCHVIARQGTEQIAKRVDITKHAKSLRFISKAGKDRLHLSKHGRIDLSGRHKQQIRSVRKLTDDSIGILREIWREAAGTESDFALESSNSPGKARSHGAGFGNVTSNEEVETAAMKIAAAWYEKRGWNVVDVSDKGGLGYDLQCVLSGREKHVEVKGMSGDRENFHMTLSEKERSETDDDYVVFVVTETLSSRPKSRRYNRAEFARKFRLNPDRFKAARREDA